jgi:hypothetical protein
MIFEVPRYGLRAYALFFSKHGLKEEFRQSELEWIMGSSMRKKLFSVLLNRGWIRKASRNTYVCVGPDTIMRGLLEFKVQDIIKNADKDYTFTNLSAIEIWSDYAYVQRGLEKSPYFVKVLEKDLNYWKAFFNANEVPNYVGGGSTIGEYVILIPVKRLFFVEKDGFKVESLENTMNLAKSNDIFLYAYNYMRNKYGASSN